MTKICHGLTGEAKTYPKLEDIFLKPRKTLEPVHSG
jgi:hypothetical protein